MFEGNIYHSSFTCIDMVIIHLCVEKIMSRLPLQIYFLEIQTYQELRGLDSHIFSYHFYLNAWMIDTESYVQYFFPVLTHGQWAIVTACARPLRKPKCSNSNLNLKKTDLKCQNMSIS